MALGLFEGVGIEIEYAVLDQQHQDVAPVADRYLREQGEQVMSVRRGPVAWSNELVLHVLELKTDGPVARPFDTHVPFVQAVNDLNAELRADGYRLMPGAAHPWMNPARETVLWPHEDHEIYATFDRLFNCRRHGWANLQSMHLNLPFSGDEEFRRLHNAMRMVISLVPALAASSPYLDGRFTGFLDGRMDVYRSNSAAIPEITGQVVPDVYLDEAHYAREVYDPLARVIGRLDPENILDPVWLNARGAIARFDRGAVELRVVDTQECPAADLAVADLIVATLKALCEDRWCALERTEVLPTELMATVLADTIVAGEDAEIKTPALLEVFGLRPPCRSGDVWQHLAGSLDLDAASVQALGVIFQHGTLARRMLHVAGEAPSHAQLQSLVAQLCDCLQHDRMFLPDR